MVLNRRRSASRSRATSTPLLTLDSIVLITGATQGLGRETALSLARTSRFSHIILGCRDLIAARQLAAEPDTNGRLIVLENSLDLSSGDSIRLFSSALKSWLSGRSITSLIFNAGAPASLGGVNTTTDGYERTFATNHLGHFSLLIHLAPVLIRGGACNIISVASDAHDPTTGSGCPDPAIGWPESNDSIEIWDQTIAGIAGGRRASDSDRIRTTTLPFAGALRYSRSKLENVLFIRELAKLAPHASVSAFNPGILLDTAFVRVLLGTFVAAIARSLVPLLVWTPLGRMMRTAPQSGAALATIASYSNTTTTTTNKNNNNTKGHAIYYDAAPTGGPRVSSVSPWVESSDGVKAASALWKHSERWLIPSHASRSEINIAMNALSKL